MSNSEARAPSCQAISAPFFDEFLCAFMHHHACPFWDIWVFLGVFGVFRVFRGVL
jgi:hypothetical protein